LDELLGVAVFLKLDLKVVNHQIRMRGEGMEKTTFRTHRRHYEFLVIPFGLSKAHFTFQSLINDVFKAPLGFCCSFYDILIYNKDLIAHVEHLSQVSQK